MFPAISSRHTASTGALPTNAVAAAAAAAAAASTADQRKQALAAKSNAKREAAKSRWQASVDPKSGSNVLDAKANFLHNVEKDPSDIHARRRGTAAETGARSTGNNTNNDLARHACGDGDDVLVSPETDETDAGQEGASPELQDELLRVVSRVQELTIHFTELTQSMDGRNAQLGRVLAKLRARYVNCFEQVLAVTSRMQAAKEETIRQRAVDLNARERELRVRIMTLESDHRVLRAQSNATDLVVRTQRERIGELEEEVDHLRTMLRGESEDLLTRARTPRRPEVAHESSMGAIADTCEYANMEAADSGLQENASDRANVVELTLERPLQALDTLVKTFEDQGETKQLILSNMEMLLQAAEQEARRNKANDAKYMVAKLRGEDVALVEMRDKGTMTTATGGTHDQDTVDIIAVSQQTRRETLWWKAFNLARCPRCKVEVQKELTAAELVTLESRAAESSSCSPAVGSVTAKAVVTDACNAVQDRSQEQSVLSPIHDNPADPSLPLQTPRDVPESALARVRWGPASAIAENTVETEAQENDASLDPQSSALDQKRGDDHGPRLSPEIMVRVMNFNKNNFEMPKDLADFLTNLPQTVMSSSPQSLEWTLARIQDLYDDKLEADRSDVNDGLPLQRLGAFVIEQFLYRHGIRRIAEVRLFELLQAVRAHMKKHARIKLFARFLDAFHYKHDETGNRIQNNNILQVFLQIRQWLLRPAAAQRYYESNQTAASLEEQQQEDGGDSNVDCIIPCASPGNHIVAADVIEFEKRTYVPLERAVKFLRALYSTFLPPRKVNMYCRAVEKMAAVHSEYTNVKGARVAEIRVTKGVTTGDRTTVRMRMRNALLQGGEADAKAATEHPHGRDRANRVDNVVIDIDKALESLVKVLLAREHHVEEKLRHLFIRGDIDGDGVLTFQEFTHIVQKANAGLSGRKILRIFREACTAAPSQGDGGGLSLTPEVFQRVCQAYDVIPIVDFAAVAVAARAAQG